MEGRTDGRTERQKLSPYRFSSKRRGTILYDHFFPIFPIFLTLILLNVLSRKYPQLKYIMSAALLFKCTIKEENTVNTDQAAPN